MRKIAQSRAQWWDGAGSFDMGPGFTLTFNACRRDNRSRLPTYADQLILRFVVFGLGGGTDNRKPSEAYRPVRDRHERACLKGLGYSTPHLF
jgi:hypothetical protein